MAGVLALGWTPFRFQARLPYKRMLLVTGLLICAAQVVGWMPIHPLRWLTLPYLLGLWFGVYPTWEGLGMQVAATHFVIGSYVLAERVQKQGARHSRPQPAPASRTLAHAHSAPSREAASEVAN